MMATLEVLLADGFVVVVELFFKLNLPGIIFGIVFVKL
jgi:hypothetical protein